MKDCGIFLERVLRLPALTLRLQLTFEAIPLGFQRTALGLEDDQVELTQWLQQNASAEQRRQSCCQCGSLHQTLPFQLQLQQEVDSGLPIGEVHLGINCDPDLRPRVLGLELELDLDRLADAQRERCWCW